MAPPLCPRTRPQGPSTKHRRRRRRRTSRPHAILLRGTYHSVLMGRLGATITGNCLGRRRSVTRWGRRSVTGECREWSLWVLHGLECHDPLTQMQHLWMIERSCRVGMYIIILRRSARNLTQAGLCPTRRALPGLLHTSSSHASSYASPLAEEQPPRNRSSSGVVVSPVFRPSVHSKVPDDTVVGWMITRTWARYARARREVQPGQASLEATSNKGIAASSFLLYTIAYSSNALSY